MITAVTVVGGGHLSASGRESKNGGSQRLDGAQEMQEKKIENSSR